MAHIKRLIGIGVIAGALAAPLSAQAQNIHVSRLYEQVLQNIEFTDPGHALDSFGVIRLNDGAVVTVMLDVPLETSIQVMGDCDEDCVDLDLVVYDDAGEVLAEDRLDDFYPIANFLSGASGRITLELHMVDCAAAYCYTAYSVFVDERY